MSEEALLTQANPVWQVLEAQQGAAAIGQLQSGPGTLPDPTGVLATSAWYCARAF